VYQDATIEDPDRDLLDLALSAREGDLRAFEELVKRHQGRILADCRHLTRDSNDSEDLAQEVFVKAYFALQRFEGRSTFRHWLQRIKVHHCLNHIKKTKGRKSVALEEEIPEDHEQLRSTPEVSRQLEQEADRRRIDAALGAMSPALRVALVMRDMDELSYEEIATALGIGLSAAKMRVKRAREQFRTYYLGEDLQDGAGEPG
jgi:RNA polymerase sigma-70 factor (ECF subfamily)